SRVMSAGFARCVATDAVFGRMVRNFTSVQGFWCRPTLTCRNRGEPGARKPRSSKTASRRKAKTSPITEKITSRTRIMLGDFSQLFVHGGDGFPGQQRACLGIVHHQ